MIQDLEEFLEFITSDDYAMNEVENVLELDKAEQRLQRFIDFAYREGYDINREDLEEHLETVGDNTENCLITQLIKD